MRRTLVVVSLLAAALPRTGPLAGASGGAGELTTSASVSPPVVGTAVAFDATPPLSEMKPVKPKGGEPKNIGESGDEFVEQRPHKRDRALQEATPEAAMPEPLRTFDEVVGERRQFVTEERRTINLSCALENRRRRG